MIDYIVQLNSNNVNSQMKAPTCFTVRFNCQRREVNFPPRFIHKMPKITSQVKELSLLRWKNCPGYSVQNSCYLIGGAISYILD